MADLIFASVPFKIMHGFHIPVYAQIAKLDAGFYERLAKVGYESNPLESDELSDYVVQPVAMTTLLRLRDKGLVGIQPLTGCVPAWADRQAASVAPWPILMVSLT